MNVKILTTALTIALFAAPAFGQSVYKCPSATPGAPPVIQQMPCSPTGGGEKQQPSINHERVGRVVGITDGDTLTLLTPDNRQVKVRLVDIDAPEHDQPGGDKAKQALSNLAFGKEVRIADQGTDKYGRTLGRVYVGTTDVNAALVAQGAAWVYRQYNRDPKLLDLEASAKNNRQGLWALPESQRVPPWEWRHGAAATAVTTVSTDTVKSTSASQPPAHTSPSVEVPTPAQPALIPTPSAVPASSPAPVAEPKKVAPAPTPSADSGCPADKPHHVSGYTRKNGTVVQDYCRR